MLDVVVAQVAHRRRRQVVEPELQADGGGVEQVRPTTQVALEQTRHPDPDGRGAAQHRVAVQITRDRRDAFSRPSRLGGVARPRGEEGVPGQGEAECARVVGGREDLDGGVDMLRGQGAIGGVPGETGECGVRSTDRDGLSQRAPQLQRLLPRRDRVAEPVGEVQVERQCLEQAGAGGGVVPDVPQRGLEEGDGFPVCSGARRLGCGVGRVLQRPGGVAGRGGMVGEHAGVAAGRLERVDHRRVQRRLGAGGGRLQDRAPDDLVPEGHPAPVPVDQAGGGERADDGRRHVESVEQLPADRLRGARQQLQTVPGRRGQPGDAGEHGVADALGERGVRLGQDLADEERVARGAAVHLGRVGPLAVEERADGGPAQRGQLEPAGLG